MSFSLTSKNRRSSGSEKKDPTSGYLNDTDAGRENSTQDAAASAASSQSLLADAKPDQPVPDANDPLISKFIPERCMPIYWEEEVSEPVDLFDKEGAKEGYKIVTTGAGYTITNVYNLAGERVRSDYQSVYGDWSTTQYEYDITSADGEQQHRVTSSGQNGQYTWSSYEIADAKGNPIESSFENSDGYKSSTKQVYSKGADGSVEKISITSKGSGTGYNYDSYTEYDGNWNLLKSIYSDGNGYTSSTDREPIVDAAGVIQGYSVFSKGSGSAGYWYESTETLDQYNNLIANTYKDSSGYFSERTSERQKDPVWGEVLITKDVSGSGDGLGKTTYTATAKYTLDWRVIETEHTDASGYSSMLTTTIKTTGSGETIYLQTYKFQYADGSTSEWTNEYNEQWQPIVDGKPVEESPILWKTPLAAGSFEPEVIPVVEKTAVSDFQTTVKSSSDTVSESAVTGLKGKRDQLKGSDANDVFVVNDKADKIVSGQKGDSDSIMTEAFSLDLRAGKWNGIENAMLAGTGNFNLTGDAGANILSGNGGDNLIRGGAGADTLFGGGGQDIFVISKNKAIDKMIDFVSGEDKIALSGSSFRSLFNKKNQLIDGVIDDKLKVDKAGGLWFDPDGSGPKAEIQIALIGVNDTIQQTDFVLIR